MLGKPVEGTGHPGLRLGGTVHGRHVALNDAHLRATVAEVYERGAAGHGNVRLDPSQRVWRVDLGVGDVHWVLGAIGVINHDRVEYATDAQVDGDVLDRRTDADRPPKSGQVLGLGHAGEDELSWSVVDAGELGLAEVARGVTHLGFPLLLGFDFRSCRRAERLSKRSGQDLPPTIAGQGRECHVELELVKSHTDHKEYLTKWIIICQGKSRSLSR